MSTSLPETRKKREAPYESQRPLALGQVDMTNKLNLLTEELRDMKLQIRPRRICNLDTQTSSITGDQLHGSILIVPNNAKENTIYLLPFYREIFGDKTGKSFEIDMRNDSKFDVQIKANSTAFINGTGIIEAQSGSRWYLAVSGDIYTLVRLT